MQEDRYQAHKIMYVVGLVSLLLGLSLIALGFFVLPRLLWDLKYQVPEWIMGWNEVLLENWQWSQLSSAGFIFLCLLIPGLILGFVSYWISNRLDQDLPNLELKEEAEKTQPVMTYESPKSVDEGVGHLLLRLIVAIGVMLLILWGIEWWMLYDIRLGI